MADPSYGKFAGLRNTVPAERMKPEDLLVARNVDLDNGQRLSRRSGQTLLVAGSVHSLWAEDATCLYVRDGSMFQLTPQLASIEVAAGLSDAPMAYVRVGERVYHANGATSAVLTDGAVRGWGIPIDQIAVNATLIPTGTLPAGVYQFAMTWLRDDGQESGTGLATRIDLPAQGGLRFSWAVPDDLSIVGAILYLTDADSKTLLQALQVDIEAGQADYLGGPRSLPLATQWYDVPPAGQCLAHYKGRIYIAAGAHLYATTPLGYEYCDVRDFRSFDGSTITVLGAVDGGLFIGTERGLYFLGGANFAENTLQILLNSACVAGSLASGDGMAVTGRTELSGRRVLLLTTVDGVVLGLPDGSIQNLTLERYQFTPGARGAAVLRLDPTLSQYLITTDLS
jgi:hypothetical protein